MTHNACWRQEREITALGARASPLNTRGRECHLNPFSTCPGEDAQRKRRQVQHRGPRGTQPTTVSPDSCSIQPMTALILMGAKRLQISLPSKGGVKACPQVVVACQGCQRTGRIAVALVQEGCEGCVHPLGALWAAKLLCLEHLKCKGKGRSLNRTVTAEQRRASSFTANFPAPARKTLSRSAACMQGTESASGLLIPNRMVSASQLDYKPPISPVPYSTTNAPGTCRVLRRHTCLCGHYHYSPHTSSLPPCQHMEAFTARPCVCVGGGACAPSWH